MTDKRLPTKEDPPPEPDDGIQDHGEKVKPDRAKPLPEPEDGEFD